MTNPMELLWFLKIAGPVLAIRLGLAAQRDEENGRPFTAAMEWRKAAELLTFISPANFSVKQSVLPHANSQTPEC